MARAGVNFSASYEGKAFVMKRTILVTVSSLLVCFIANDTVEAQPALRELENRLNRLIAPPSEPPATPPAPRDTVEAPRRAAEPGYVGMFADNAGVGVRGALITSINRGGPAEAAGLRTGDLITSANGALVSSIDDLSSVLDRANAGDTVVFNVLRDGATRSVKVELSRRPGSDAPAIVPPAPSSALPEPAPGERDSAVRRGSLGVRVVAVTDEWRIRYGIPVRRGAFVQSLTTGGPAERAGLRIGSVIVSIDGRRVDTPDDLVGYIRTTLAGQKVDIDYYQGDRLDRIQVELGTIGASPLVRPSSPPRVTTPSILPGTIFGEDRPALRKIESVIDRLVAPAPAPAPAAVPVAPSSETVELRAQVEALQRQIEGLQRQMVELERRLAEKD